MYCIYTEGSHAGSGRIASRPMSKASAVALARHEARWGRLRRCDFVAVMPLTRAHALIRQGARA